MDAREVIGLLMQNVSRNGTMLLNITQHGRGDLDPQVIQICKDIGAWLKVNGEAVYASRPFEVCEEKSNSVCYTRNNGNVYATLLNWTNGPITLKALRAGGATLGKVSKVELLGSDVPLTFVQDDQGLTVTPSGPVQPLAGITNQSLASACRVLRITHDKGWINDDDPGRNVSRMDSPLQPGHRRLQQRPHHQRNARRCLELFVHRQQRLKSSRRKKRAPERSRFRLTAKPVRRRICPPRARARPSRWYVK